MAALIPATAHAAITTEPNRSRITLDGFDPAAPGLVELVRNGLVIGRSSGTGNFVVNGGECWAAFTPQIRDGDDIRVNGSVAMTVQGPLTIDAPGVPDLGGNLGVTGNAQGAGPFTISLPGAGVSDVSVTSGAFTAPFTGVGAQPDFARLEAGPAGGITRVNSDDPTTPGPATGCPSFNADAVTAFDATHLINGAPIINAGNVGQVLTTAGPTGANDGPVTAGLQGTTVTGTATGHTWSAQFSPADLAALPEGSLVAGVGSGGATLGIFKDTVAPPQPTSSPPPGRYLNAPTVSLAAEPGSRIHFTVDGSQPTPASPTYTAPVRVGSSSTIKAFAVDAVGNAGPTAALVYQLGPGAGAPGTNPGGSNNTGSGTKPGGTPKAGAARITVLKVSKRQSLKRLRTQGLGVGVQLAPGTAAVRFMVSRRIKRKSKRVYKLVASVVRTPGSPRYRARLNARALGLVKVGVYQLKVVPGLTRTTLDPDAARTIFLRVVR